MINKKMADWLEMALRITVVVTFIVFVLATMNGILRWLTAGVLAASIVLFLMKRGRPETDEREVYLNYVANTMAFMTTWATIAVVGIYQYLHYGHLSRGIILLIITAGLSQGVYQAVMRRLA
ncbi:MAG: hypothetical protein PHU21_04465 [Elusimicrobia bacterium]|nr:hypothetical protein [Elusimicrobiota bacterium]